MKALKVLVACEESQAVTKAFRALGHEAYSCDLIDCSGGHPNWHIKDDCLNHLFISAYDLRIGFPPCTDLAVSGARWFDKKRLDGSQENSITFFLNVWRNSHCVENPIGIMNDGRYVKKWFPKLYIYANYIKFPFKPSQIIQPWQFGHMETKATCLWLNDLPSLVPTDNVYDEMMKLPYGKRAKVHHASPGPERSKLRSKTYTGIAEAMATQWSEYLTHKTENK